MIHLTATIVPCAVCGRDSERGRYGSIPLCLDCYLNRPNDVLACEAMARDVLRDIHTGTDAVERSHLSDAQWAEYVKMRDAAYGQDEHRVPVF